MPESQSGTDHAVIAELPFLPAAPVTTRLVLEITRGRTRFPQRPVTGPKFLIGAGVTCDLRLGGEGTPPLHSIITVDDSGIHIEAIVSSPTLIVNGRGLHEGTLGDGDVITIGEVELLARVSAGRAPAGVQIAAPAAAAADAAERAPSELSAAELIERIEADQRMIDQLEAGRETGARALMAAARGRTASPKLEQRAAAPARRAVPAPHFLSKRPQVLAARGRSAGKAESEAGPETDTVFLEELEQLGRQLTNLSQEMRDGSQRATQRESQHAAANDMVMETQHRLASQLEALLSQVAAMQDQTAAPRSRAIA